MRVLLPHLAQSQQGQDPHDGDPHENLPQLDPAVHTFSITRSLALRARGLAATSPEDASRGRRTTLRRVRRLPPQRQTGSSRGQTQSFSSAANTSFTLRSSTE